MKPIFSDIEDVRPTRGAPRYKSGDVVSPSDWECIAIAFGFSSAVAMFQTFKKADDRREEWLNWSTDKAIANRERSR